MSRDPYAANGRQRSRALAAASAAVGLALALGLSEGVLRLAGRTPWRSVLTPINEPVMHEPDPVLGWRAKPGSYAYPGYAPGAPDVRQTYLADGARATGYRGEGGEDTVALIGDSLMQGWGLSDEETLAWKLQERFPELRFVNYGTGGYGTYQSLLVLERLLAAPDPPRLVIYDFIPVHEDRNVAAPDWLHSLSLTARRGIVAVPFATLANDGGLRRHPPQAYPAWPLHDRLALVALAENAWLRLRSAGRASQGRPVTQAILKEMRERCAARGVGFIVVFFWAPLDLKRDYASFLREHGVRYTDCTRRVTLDLIIAGEGHPNGALNTIWADCISRRIPLRELSR